MADSTPASFYASPAEALDAPPEEFLYVACLHEGTGVERPDFLAVVDAESGRIVHELAMPNVGDELHRYGWNRCGSACHGPDRSHLIVPGFRSSRIHVVDVASDPRRPRLDKVIEPAELLRATGLTRPHTVHYVRPTTSSSACSATPTATAPAASPCWTRAPSRSRAAGRTAASGRGSTTTSGTSRARTCSPPSRSSAAEGVRGRLRPGRRRGGPLRQPPALLEPERAARRADARGWARPAGAARDALAARSRRRRGLRRRGAVEHDVALPAPTAPTAPTR